MLGLRALQRKLRRMARRRQGPRPEEKVFERFSERFGAPASCEREPRQEPQEGPQRERQRTTPHPAPIAPTSPALAVLGLGVGASPVQIATAYRRLARTYHPDKVAAESQEVREFAEERMKEINAAYSELKRSG